MNAKVSIVTAGYIGAGKTTAANIIASKLDCPVLSFVQTLFVPILATLRVEPTRSELQKLGSSLMVYPGERVLVEALVSHCASDALVVDDVRYPTTIDLIREQRSLVRVLFVEAPPDIRRMRAAKRDGSSLGEVRHAESQNTEKRIADLRDCSDLVVDNSGSLADLERAISSTIKVLDIGPQ